jgi:hypothetical protein
MTDSDKRVRETVAWVQETSKQAEVQGLVQAWGNGQLCREGALMLSALLDALIPQGSGPAAWAHVVATTGWPEARARLAIAIGDVMRTRFGGR